MSVTMLVPSPVAPDPARRGTVARPPARRPLRTLRPLTVLALVVALAMAASLIRPATAQGVPGAMEWHLRYDGDRTVTLEVVTTAGSPVAGALALPAVFLLDADGTPDATFARDLAPTTTDDAGVVTVDLAGLAGVDAADGAEVLIDVHPGATIDADGWITGPGVRVLTDLRVHLGVPATERGTGPAPTDAPAAGFTDVAPGATHATGIDRVTWWGIARGCHDGADGPRFCPGDGLTRAQLASLLVATFELPAGPPAGFVDVPAVSVHAAAIDAVAAAGITRGCPATDAGARYCPWDTVTRGQLATLLHEALGLPVAEARGFVDVASSTHAVGIDGLVAYGFARGCADDAFCPEAPVTRAQVATLLAAVLE